MTQPVYLYTDGSCLGNPGPGGWAALLRYGTKEMLIKGGEKNTTNNRMELLAVIEGLKKLKRTSKIIICSDSQYMAKAFTDGWIIKWKKNGWQTAQKKPVANQDLWLALDELMSAHSVSFTWVKGHSGHPENELVDQAARSEAECRR